VLWRECEPAAAVVIDSLPCYRIAGGMGAATLAEGFDRAEVAQVMRWHQIEDEPECWSIVAYCERAIAAANAEKREKESSGEMEPDKMAAALEAATKLAS